jgi:dienelactone hydrolase
VSPHSQTATPLPVEHPREGLRSRAMYSRVAQGVRAASWETTLAVAALALIALHVLDDSFFQPQPGTSASDHLVSGLVPFAVLVGVGACYSRARPGLRAALAATLGIFGVVAGIEAVYYLNAGRLSGDDYTGLAAIPAGLVLVAIAVATLWRTRRIDDSLPWRWARRTLLAVATVVGAYVLVSPFLVSYVLTHSARAFVPADRVGAAHENVSFTTSDGLRLRGWYVPSKNGAAVISFPGRKGTQRPARMLARHGYGVLLFDRRGEGESDGDPNGWGWAGYRDVAAAVRFLQQRTDVDQDRIGGIGLSVGGEMMLEAAARTPGLKAVVSEGAGERSVREYLDMTVSDKWVGLPTYFMLSAGIALFTNHTPPPSLKDLVGRIAPTPVYFIYGEHGQPGERNLNPTYYEAARKPKAIWQVPGSGHVGGLDARPKEYERRVVGFFDRTLLEGQGD